MLCWVRSFKYSSNVINLLLIDPKVNDETITLIKQMSRGSFDGKLPEVSLK